MKRYALCMILCTAGCLAFSQEQSYTTLGAATTGTATNLTGTTGTAVAPGDANSTAAEMIRRNFSEENFEKRWEMEEGLYKEAGISEEKIARLKEINKKMWDARAKGEKTNFEELSRQRQEVLSSEEIEKLRNTRRNMIQQKLNERSTTGTNGI